MHLRVIKILMIILLKCNYNITMITKEQIEAIWNSLKDNPLAKMKKCVERLPIFAGVNKDTVSIIFLVDINTNVSISPVCYKNVEIDIQKLSYNEKGIVVSMFQPCFYNIFLTIAVDLINTVDSQNDNSLFLSCFINRLNAWRRLFDKGVGTLLSKEQQLGLYGELYYLRSLLNEGINPEIILDCWVGPEGEDKDFKFNDVAVEIKSSVNIEKKCSISNLVQLDETNYKLLFLYTFIFSRTQNGINTLPNLIKDIQNHLNDMTINDLFVSKLLQVGYLESDSVSYTTSYALFEESAFLIKDDFPRITTTNVSRGVTKASYEIDLNICSKYQVTFKDVVKEIK